MSDRINNNHISINQIDREVYVKRLQVDYYGGYGITDQVYSYGIDNLYPDKCKATAQRSNSLTTAIKTFSRFVSGGGFTNYGNGFVNSDDMTANELLSFIASEHAEIGIAIHVKYNVFGEIAELVPLRFEQVRKGIQGNLFIRASWDLREIHKFGIGQQTPIEVLPFNPQNAINEIKEVGFENYTGQLIYFHNSLNEVYPLARYDAVLDDAQFEADAKIYSLSNMHNEFSMSGVFKYPKALESTDEGQELIKKLNTKGKGEVNKGRFIAMGLPPSAMEKNLNVWESFTHPNSDTMYLNSREDAKKNIYEIYQQPSIINGRTDSGMFNAQSMQDAFDFYNSVTESDRKQIESLFNYIYPVLAPFEIIPLTFIKK